MAQHIKNTRGTKETQKTRFDPWVGKTPWRRARQPTPVFLPGGSRGQRSLAGHSPWGCTESDTTERLSTQGSCRKALPNPEVRTRPATETSRSWLGFSLQPGLQRFTFLCCHPAFLPLSRLSTPFPSFISDAFLASLHSNLFKKTHSFRASMVVQWLRIHLPMQGIWVQSQIREDPTCHEAISLCTTTEALEPLEPVPGNKRSHHNEKPAHHT